MTWHTFSNLNWECMWFLSFLTCDVNSLYFSISFSSLQYTLTTNLSPFPNKFYYFMESLSFLIAENFQFLGPVFYNIPTIHFTFQYVINYPMQFCYNYFEQLSTTSIKNKKVKILILPFISPLMVFISLHKPWILIHIFFVWKVDLSILARQ